eukprot:CAMPEP_0185032250 /NCGR_PEP_ID=MMETSP1103-20130426/20198_1 /TAXON_ID=36769 /ORGANISM="Paraphysomonas bandaiensis, Strain Caron Lab Isolate" /LENGTH=697 /DNA_ID=CAMNT_0027568079 /DNA_START=1 /DNA_END=2094 /DNA_ORIENTATION=+
MKMTRASMDEENIADLTSIIAEFPEGDDDPKRLPIKKLQMTFDDMAKGNKDDGCMKVYIRVRPIAAKIESTVRVASDTRIVTSAPEVSRRAQYTRTEERHYSFHRVFGPTTAQSDVFDKAVLPLVTRFINGESCILFAYGITNAGKTHTIQGTPQDPGILPRLVNKLLEELSPSDKADITLSMFEIYQEKLFDLLSKRTKLSVRDRNGQVEINNLSHHPVTSSKEAHKLITKGSSKRSNGHTLLNSGSSRSHAIYTISLRGQEFQIIDLAGAERNSRTKASGAQAKEANNINMSLMQLWRCLQGLKKRTSDSQETIPCRESKLTHVLMSRLYSIGTAGIAMIACINPSDSDYDETLSVLGNASLACDIKEVAPMARLQQQRSSVLAAPERPVSRKRDASGMQRKSSVVGAVAEAQAARAEAQQAVKAKAAQEEELMNLQEKIALLEAENAELTRGQVLREQEIREEVCGEMAERSSSLLERIKELQDELYDLKNDRSDLHKSVKKAKRMHSLRTQEVTTRDLQEAEEELESTRTAYEKEIKSLKNEIRALRAEASDWKKKAETAMRQLARRDTESSTTSQGSACSNNENDVANSVAESFDKRFNKHRKPAEMSPKFGSKKHEQKREPLSPVSPNVSSGEDSVSSNKSRKIPKMRPRPQSPYRESDAPPIAPPQREMIVGSGPFYPTRSLRSQSQLRV